MEYVKSKNTGAIILVDQNGSEDSECFSGWQVENGKKIAYSNGWTKESFEEYFPNMCEKLIEGVKIVISESKNFICISVCREDDRSMSWEELQAIKDEYYPNLDFVEVYPKSDEIINKANERHLICQRGSIVPKLGDLEEEARIIVTFR